MLNVRANRTAWFGWRSVYGIAAGAMLVLAAVVRSQLPTSQPETAITWREDFVATRPGSAGLIGWFLRGFVQRCADGLARHAALAGSADVDDTLAGRDYTTVTASLAGQPGMRQLRRVALEVDQVQGLVGG